MLLGRVERAGQSWAPLFCEEWGGDSWGDGVKTCHSFSFLSSFFFYSFSPLMCLFLFWWCNWWGEAWQLEVSTSPSPLPFFSSFGCSYSEKLQQVGWEENGCVCVVLTFPLFWFCPASMARGRGWFGLSWDMETRAWMTVRVPGGKCPTLAGSKEGRKGRL